MSDFPSQEAVSEPKRIQVFGVLHVVFGGLGLLNICLLYTSDAADDVSTV